MGRFLPLSVVSVPFETTREDHDQQRTILHHRSRQQQQNISKQSKRTGDGTRSSHLSADSKVQLQANVCYALHEGDEIKLGDVLCSFHEDKPTNHHVTSIVSPGETRLFEEVSSPFRRPTTRKPKRSVRRTARG